MRCWQAKQKLKLLGYNNSEIAKNQMLSNHLNECSACASLMAAENSLRSDFQAAAVDDNEEVVSNWLLKAQVERQAADANRSQFRENHLMAAFTNLLKKQSKLTIGVTTVAVVLLLSVLIPFSYNKTIGYEVAFAGVDKNLAMDSDKLQLLLEKLGIEGAVIDISGCEATCNVKITDLKSPDDAKLVLAAFNEIDHVDVLEKVKKVFELKNGNIYAKLLLHNATGQDGIVYEVYDDANDIDMHNVLVEKFGEDLHQILQIWSSDSINCDDIALDPSQNAFFFSSDDRTSVMDIKTESGDDGIITIIVNAGTDEEKTLTLPADGNYDEETLQMIEDMGLDIQMLNGSSTAGSGSKSMSLHKVIEFKNCDEDATNSEDDSDEAAAKLIGELPEEFELSQNYPNPFNPTTTINFSIPSGQHVSLDIINIKGQVVKTLINQNMSAGTHSITWDATNSNGAKVASGVYLYKLTTPDKTDVKKMTLMK